MMKQTKPRQRVLNSAAISAPLTVSLYHFHEGFTLWWAAWLGLVDMYMVMRVSMDQKTIILSETQQVRALSTGDNQREQMSTKESPRDVEAI